MTQPMIPPPPDLSVRLQARRVRLRIDYVEHRGGDDLRMSDHSPSGYTVEGWGVVLPFGLLVLDDDVEGWTLHPWHTVTWVDVDYVPVNADGSRVTE